MAEMTQEMLMEALKEAFVVLNRKQRRVQLLWDYFEGKQPLRWSADKLKELFHDQVEIAENWCSIVIESVTDKIHVEHISTGEKSSDDNILEVWENEGLGLEADDVHQEAIIVGESYLIVWKDEEGNLEVYHNSARNVHMFYKHENPHKRRFAAKWWTDESDEKPHVVLYFPDQIVHFKATKKLESMGDTFHESSWELQPDSEANPYGIIPVFHFRKDKRMRSDLDNAIPLQDLVNKLLSDMFVNSEFSAFPQRYAITAARLPGKLPYGSFTTLQIPPAEIDQQPAEVGTFEATDMGNFQVVLDSLSNAMAIITKTPKHYFWGQTGQVSGEALLAMESPLNAKVAKYEKRYAVEWRRCISFIFLLLGKAVDEKTIDVIWTDPSTLQPLTAAEIRKMNVDAGMPLITHLRMYDGWTEDEITAMQEEQQKSAAVTNAATTLDAAPESQAQAASSQQQQSAKGLQQDMGAIVKTLGDALINHVLESGALGKQSNG